jgi:hypothetical protein
MMRALRQALLASALLLAAAAAAAQIPPGDGTVRGRVVDDASAEGAAGVDVVLYTAAADGTAGIASSVTDTEGRFAFEGVSSDPGRVYLVGTRSGEVPLGQRVSFAPGAQEATVELRLLQHSAETGPVSVGTAFLRIDRGCERLRVNEAHELSNPTKKVIYVPEAERPSRRPVFEAELPAEAADFTTPAGDSALGFEREGRLVRFWGPVYPGEQDLEFGYSLPQAPGSAVFERGFPAGAARVEVLTDRAGPTVQGQGLEPAEDREVQGRPYRSVASGALASGERLPLRIEVAAAEPAPVDLERAELWLELDDAALVVDESYLVQTEGGKALSASSDAPLLCLPLPDAAEALRFSSDTMRMGVEVDASGALAFRGPLPAGSSVVSLRYRLPVRSEGGSVVFARRFPRPIDLLSVFVADNHVVPETTRLHRMRSTRRDDRNFLTLEGFQIEPDEEVSVELRRLPAPRRVPRLASVGFALLAGGGALAFLIAPIGVRGRRSDASESRPARLAAEREAVYASIHDLDEDFETGTLTPEDHATLRAELRARAVALLQEERRGEPAAPAPAPRRAVFCTNCGEKLPGGANFCPQCGSRVGEAAG